MRAGECRSWEKSGRAADITAMTEFDPTSARNFCCDAQRRSGATV
jgi:hypothetical protein